MTRGPVAGQDAHKVAMKAYAKGDFGTAERLYTRILRQVPNDFNALHLLGIIRAQQSRFKEAEGLIARALMNGRSAEALSNHGNVLSELGRHDEAIRQLTQATLLNPQSPENHFNLANACVKAQNHAAAVKSFATAVALRPDFPEALENYADALRELGRPYEGVPLLERAVRLAPRDADLRIAYGAALQEIGDIEGSRKAMMEALEQDSSAASAYYHLARASRIAAEDPLLARMENLHQGAGSLSIKSRAMLNFALAKAYDDVGRYDDAFARLTEASRMVRATITYDEAGEQRQFERLKQAFNAELFEARRDEGWRSETPIFIVGFPRSGTTLTEQILASHPAVHGAGEQSILSTIASSDILKIEHGVGSVLGFPESLAHLPADRFRAAGALYVKELREGAPDRARITDKLPANFIFIGLIRLILPHARIIHVTRNAVDTCLSCLLQRFHKDHVGFSYDLGELGRQYRMYLDLMAHWRAVMPEGSFIEIRYENLVNDLEGQARRIVEYCGLPWDERCLSFHETERAVRTASVAQVRQPLYRTSVERWRRYEKHLGPLIEAIGDFE